MKLHEKLPEGVTVDGKFYRLDFDFRNVLRMMEILQKDDLTEEAREWLALRCLMRRPRNVSAVLAEVRRVLFPEQPSGDRERVMSFEQDAGLIRSAFRQEYGIDLYRERLHWIEFSELLSNLPEGSRFSEVVGIRARPVPKATKYNAAERQWLLNAKASVALKMSEKEQEEKYQRDVEKLFAGLMGMIQGDDDK